MSKSPASRHLKTLAGATDTVVESESQDEYNQGRLGTIQDLEAKSPLEIYLAEKIFDCVWWLRRLDRMRVTAIRSQMVERLDWKDRTPEVRALIERSDWEHPTLQQALANTMLTAEELLTQGSRYAEHQIQTLDRQAVVRLKMLRDLQRAYEAHKNRPLIRQRFELQNQLLQQHLQEKDITPDDK